MEHHILHSLTVSKVLKFTPGTEVMDIGTGGGFLVFRWLYFFPEFNNNNIIIIYISRFL